MTTGVLPGIRKIQEAVDFTSVPGAGSNGYSLVYQHSTQSFVLANISGGGGGTSDHAGLINLAYADAAHTGFAGTGVANTFTQNQTINAALSVSGSVTVGNDLSTTDDVIVGDDLTVNGLATIVESVSVPSIISAGNADITVNPGGTGNLKLDDNTPFRSATFDASFPIGGFKLGPTAVAGQFALTVGEIQADTLRVVTFVADETRVDRGNQYWTKSYGILAANFTTPAVSSTASVTFEDSAAFVGAIASANDWVLFRTVDVDSGISTKQSWGQLSSHVDNGDGTQSWTFTMRSGDTATLYSKGATAVIFGATGAAYIHLSVVDTTGAPYIKGRKWVTNPYTPGNHTTYWQLGNLGSTGNPNYSPVGNGLYARSGASAGQFFVLDDNGFQIRGADFEMYNSTLQTVDIASANGSLKLGTNIASGTTTGFAFDGATGNITIGGASYSPTVTIYGAVNIKAGSSGIANLSDAGALATVNNLDGVPNGSTYFRTTANQVTGAGRAYAGLDTNSVLVTAVIPASAVTPSGAGLYMDSTHLGYYSGSAWKTYMDSSGNFLFAGTGAGNYLQWVAASNKLQGVGSSVEQWYASAADGRLYAGAGNVWLASNGLNFLVQVFGAADYIRFDRSGSALATIGFQRDSGGGPLTTDGMIFTNNDGTKFRFLGASVMEIGTGGDTAVNITGGIAATKSGGFASLTVLRGALSAAATIGGTTHTSVFANLTTEHTYIRGGKAASDVYINDSSGLGNVILATGGGNVGIRTATPTLGILQLEGNLAGGGTAGLYFNPTASGGGTQYGIRIVANGAGATDFIGLGIHGGTLTNWKSSIWLGDEGGRPGINCGYAVGTSAPIWGAIFAGTVGIGNSAPNYKADIMGAGGGAANILRAGQLTVSNGFTITSDGATLIYSMLAGPLIVGGTTADYDFEVQDNGASDYRVTVNLNSSSENVIGSLNNAPATSVVPAALRLFASRIRLDGIPNIVTSSPPASASATGTTGDIAWDTSFFYVAVGTNTWKRAALSTW